MPAHDVVVASEIPLSAKAKQVCGMFDCPPEKKQRLEWKVDIPIEGKDWSIGAIIGPSGCGKSTIANAFWEDELAWQPEFNEATVIDSFASNVKDVASALGAVGFNTIPAWIRPYHVLSNGEKFRVEIAKRMLEQKGTIVIDEFTSVVDRQVAKIACHAVQKFVRKQQRQLIAISCHEDITEWLQPDWLYTPANQKFAWRSLRRFPEIKLTLKPVPYEIWDIFYKYHYIDRKLHKAANCYGLFMNDKVVSFAAVMHFPHPKRRNIRRVARTVTLPDYQGMGFAFVMLDTLAAMYKACDYELRRTPAHPSYIRNVDKHPLWKMLAHPTRIQGRVGDTGGIPRGLVKHRPCAVFKYMGPAWENQQEAERMVYYKKYGKAI